MQPSVLFFDNHILVVFKPAGLATQPSVGNEANLEDWAKKWLKAEIKKDGNVFLVPIHRLDKPVSGLVLFARSSKALSRLNEMMRERKISKRYHAEIEGKLPIDEGTLEHYLVHDKFMARVADAKEPEAKRAFLSYRTLWPQMIEVELETGRYHQIRAQFAAIGCPIVGDSKYGSKKNFPDQMIALQHVQLDFLHPVTKAQLSFKVPPNLIIRRSARC